MIELNGERLPWNESMTVAGLIEQQALPAYRLIVHINGEIVPRDDYGQRLIADEAQVKTIKLMSGG